jgi:uncharacterized membrane protein YeaQ/YmgE (transglycosylase-associated protein family)
MTSKPLVPELSVITAGRGVALDLNQVEREVVMGVLGWILFGLVVGIIARLVMPGRDPGGMIVTILLGIAGAVLGGFVGRALGFYGPEEAAGFVMAILGSLLLLFGYRMLSPKRTV